MHDYSHLKYTKWKNGPVYKKGPPIPVFPINNQSTSHNKSECYLQKLAYSQYSSTNGCV